jgi:hypothetical protein
MGYRLSSNSNPLIHSLYNQSQEPFPFNESQETPHYTVIEGEWKDDILITTISTNQGLTEEQSRKTLYNTI